MLNQVLRNRSQFLQILDLQVCLVTEIDLQSSNHTTQALLWSFADTERKGNGHPMCMSPVEANDAELSLLVLVLVL